MEAVGVIHEAGFTKVAFLTEAPVRRTAATGGKVGEGR
jgi:hypothetical protein